MDHDQDSDHEHDRDTPLVVITGHVLVAAEARDGYVDRMQDLVGRARAFGGCLHLSVTADPLDARRVNNTEVWADRESLADWREVAAPPEPPRFEDVAVGFYRARRVEPL